MPSLRHSLLCCIFIVASACVHRKDKPLILTPASPDPSPAPIAESGFAVAFSPDGANAVRLKNGVLSIFSLQGETPTTESLSIPGAETAQALSLTARWLALGYPNGEFRLYDRQEQGQPMVFRGIESPIAVLSISADESVLVVGYNNGVVAAMDIPHKKLLFSSKESESHHERVTTISVTPDGKTALSGSTDRQLKLWNLSDGILLNTMTGHSRGIWNAAISPKADYAISMSEDGSARGWDLPSGRERFFRLSSAKVSAARSDGERVVVVHAKGFALWEFSTGLELAKQSTDIPEPRAATYQASGNVFWVFTKDGELLRWALPTEVSPESFSNL
jgi:WD40 repeat protein